MPKALPHQAESKDDELCPADPTSKTTTAANTASPNTKGWLTREESARLLGVTIQTIKNYEKRRLLHPLPEARVDLKGRRYTVLIHDPAELVKVKKAAAPFSTDQDTRTWLTRDQAVNGLSVSAQTLKNYEKRGVLHPLTVRRDDKRGHAQSMVVYDPKELAKIPRAGHQLYSRDAGDIASKAFQMFEDGEKHSAIVIKLRVTPAEVRELHEEWLDAGGSCLVINSAAKEVLEKKLGIFSDIVGLVRLVTGEVDPLPQPVEETKVKVNEE
jgi:transcriptional regulator with XRE-family HTH domain